MDLIRELLEVLIFMNAVLALRATSMIHSVFFLVLVFFSCAGLFFFLGAELLGFILIIVYVGAIAILFLFVVMMINVTIAPDLFLISKKFSYFEKALYYFLFLFWYISRFLREGFASPTFTLSSNYAVYDWLSVFFAKSNIEVFGGIIYTYFYVLFLLIGVLLTVAMLGSILITSYKELGHRKQQIFSQLSVDYLASVKRKKQVF